MTNKPLLQPSPHLSDGGELIGRDPRTLTEDEFVESFQPDWNVPAKAIRAKCRDCCGGDDSEVRKCVAVSCALWPLRMGATGKPFRKSLSRVGKGGSKSKSGFAATNAAEDEDDA